VEPTLLHFLFFASNTLHTTAIAVAGVAAAVVRIVVMTVRAAVRAVIEAHGKGM